MGCFWSCSRCPRRSTEHPSRSIEEKPERKIHKQEPQSGSDASKLTRKPISSAASQPLAEAKKAPKPQQQELQQLDKQPTGTGDKELRGATRMQLIGHQVVGSKNTSHEEVKAMYIKLFKGESIQIKKMLKKEFGAIEGKTVLSQIFQVIFDSVKKMLVERLLKSPLIVEVLPSQKSSNIQDRVRETCLKGTDDRQRIFQAFKIREEMTKEEQAQSMEQAIESLFKVANFATSSSDAAIKAEMREKQMAYGILLHSCGLIEMTEDAVKSNTEDVKCKLSEASKFSAIRGFDRAKELARELLDAFINSGVHLAWTMVTRIPPMFVIQPQKHEPPNTILEDDSEDASQKTILVPLRPILFFSYEGHPAIEGILAAIPSEKHEEESSGDNLSLPSHPFSLTTVGEPEDESSGDDEMTMCASGKHKWIHNVCMVCTQCGYCTDHGSMCFNEERAPGTACGCGSCDSGCSKCGCCCMCAAEKDHYERGFALEEVPFEEEFEQTNDRLWRKHEKQQQQSEEMGQFVEMAEERVMVHTKGRVKHGPTADIDEDYFFFTKGLAVGVVKILEPMNPILNYYECGIVNGGQSGAIGIGVGEYAYPMDHMPGWDQNSCGYHADDGKLYLESGKGVAFGPTCTDGDRIGCGVDFNADYNSGYVNVFFTKNGEQVKYLGHCHCVLDVNLEPVEQDPSCIVRSINSKGTHMFVDFPEQNNWTGLNSEMEIFSGIYLCHGKTRLGW